MFVSLLPLLLCANLLSAQKTFNHSFEKFDPATGKIADWGGGIGRGSTSSYLFEIDSSTAVGGRYSARLASPKEGGEFGSFFLSFPADFGGKIITLRASVKTVNVSQDGWAGLKSRQRDQLITAWVQFLGELPEI